MAPDAEDCETALTTEDVTHQGRRILPDQQVAAQAWVENEEQAGASGPGENIRLLPAPVPAKSKPGIQAGVTLGVHAKYPQKTTYLKKQEKTKFQKRKEKLIAVLKPPYFILTMIVVIIGIHLFASEDFREYLEWTPGPWWWEPWRLFTYGFVHASTAHLALNALVALAVGWRLEREQGWWRVVLIWCSGVVAGALGAGVLQPEVRVVGASAAVYAMLMAHLPNVCLRFGHIPLWWFRPLSVVVLGASEFCSSLISSPPPVSPGQLAAVHGQNSYGHIAWSAHVLGALVGIPMAFLVFTGENNNKRYILVSRVASGVVLAAGLSLAIVFYTTWYEVEEPSRKNQL